MLSQVIRKSEAHINWCEDNNFIFEKDDFILGAVFDGCSTATNSEFSSKTLSLIFQKIVTDENMYQSLCSNTSVLNDFDDERKEENITKTYKAFIHEVAIKMASIKSLLGLGELDFLSTIIFFFYDKNNENLFVAFIGDGVLFYKGEDGQFCTIENNQNNTPSYLGYYIMNSVPSKDAFLDWTAKFFIKNVKDFSICSDGIFAFRYKVDPDGLELRDPVKFLTQDESFTHLKTGLEKKVNILKNEGWKLEDDLTVIRYKKQEKQ